jgi:hypothetical protein
LGQYSSNSLRGIPCHFNRLGALVRRDQKARGGAATRRLYQQKDHEVE